MIAQLILGLPFFYLTWSLITMEINYRRASSMGMPLVRLYVDPLNIPWVVLEPSIWRILDLLPIDFGSFRRYSRRGWHFSDKADSHLQYGPAWAIVTPRDIYVQVADPNAIHDIFFRPEDFLRPSKMYKLLEVYGPCISTASWTDWGRHRKILAAPFNESMMKFVWTESLNQARQMLQTWTYAATSSIIPSVPNDLRTLSLNVLASHGFHRSYKFCSSKNQGLDEAQRYRDSLETVLDNALFLMFIPYSYLTLPFLPRTWRRIGRAGAEFKRQMKTMLDDEIRLISRGEPGTGSIMTAFVRALNTNEKDRSAGQHAEGQSTKGLNVDEIFGNIFTVNFAGHASTANTLAFSVLLLAAYPEVQDWVAKEVQQILPSRNSEDWNYAAAFTELKRCRAVLFETLRLYPSILALPKWTNEQPQRLRIGGGRTITIPPQTGVMPSLLAVHTHPKYWRDPLLWQPSRWILPPSPASPAPYPHNASLSSQLQQETIFAPAQSTYFPWSDGPQNCPGSKFVQVEFVAVLASLLRNHRVGAIREPGESRKEAQARVLATTQDCNLEMLLRMRDADRVRLECKRVP